MKILTFERFKNLECIPMPLEPAFLNLVPKQRPGVYILFKDFRSDRSSVLYIGRSDKDLRQRLSRHNHREKAKSFCYFPCTSPIQAYVYEKKLFIHFSPFLNLAFPALPFNYQSFFILKIQKHATN
ncbi:MAG: hypothetical protein EOP04_00555 [Proteobacteria bacterium]|nr:MAG: hypothetical protein EOP04_00555 [Pseudomonadota bacterium]